MSEELYYILYRLPDSSPKNPLSSSTCITVRVEETNLEKIFKTPEAEFKEFEPRLKFETRLKHGWWFHLKLYSVFRDLSRRLIGTSFWFKLFKFGLSAVCCK